MQGRSEEGGVRGTDNQQQLGVEQGETGLCVHVHKCVYVHVYV